VVVRPRQGIDADSDRHGRTVPKTQRDRRCAFFASTYFSRAAFVFGEGDTSATGTSHHAPPASVVLLRSVSMTTTLVSFAAIARSRAPGNSASDSTFSARAPSDRA